MRIKSQRQIHRILTLHSLLYDLLSKKFPANRLKWSLVLSTIDQAVHDAEHVEIICHKRHQQRAVISAAGQLIARGTTTDTSHNERQIQFVAAKPHTMPSERYTRIE